MFRDGLGHRQDDHVGSEEQITKSCCIIRQKQTKKEHAVIVFVANYYCRQDRHKFKSVQYIWGSILCIEKQQTNYQ